MEEDRDEAGGGTVYWRTKGASHIAPWLPLGFGFKLPFSRHYILIGHVPLERFRKRARQRPDDGTAHLVLGSQLLARSPARPEAAREAVDALLTALRRLPAEVESNPDAAHWLPIAHFLMGDALNVLGRRAEAREHWQKAAALAPVPSRYGIADGARARLEENPDG
jgi:hypothetical protein